jgi:hypothetical protein
MTPSTIPAEPRAPRCNGKCGQPGIVHRLHLFVDGAEYPLRVEREGAYAWLPDGKVLWRGKPDAVLALKGDVRHWREALR